MEGFDIPVKIGEELKTFDFRYSDETAFGQACFVDCEGRELILDSDFGVVIVGMPGRWVPAIINMLKVVLNKGGKS